MQCKLAAENVKRNQARCKKIADIIDKLIPVIKNTQKKRREEIMMQAKTIHDLHKFIQVVLEDINESKKSVGMYAYMHAFLVRSLR